ncbi:MAG: hypothetical protein FJZ83_04935 [Chloroflexi bacterium]|nr:hypothetical protein [Chloroflexota bacterium]MBM3183363.1 hypothetical protein [Chloroflexota bacterium]MBM4451637.1 hypothetical protein [Chloroflexota bacterium]MBM4453459.1 hypothetical protein [Chloroflexota bacterium]
MSKLDGIVMTDIIDRKLHEWTQGKSITDARISIYYKVRDIPYAVIPDFNGPEQYVDMLRLNRGSCTPKHLLMCKMYQRLGLEVLYAVYPFRWDAFEAIYPPRLRRLAQAMPLSHHLACKVDINGNLILVDATLDLGLQKLGLPVTQKWDGHSDTNLAMNPCDEEQLYHPLEAHLMQPRTLDEKSLSFYNALNSWLDEIRHQ